MLLNDKFVEYTTVNLSVNNQELKLSYKILNPEKYITKINYDIDDELNIEKIHLFSYISNSTEYIKLVRQNTWHRF